MSDSKLTVVTLISVPKPEHYEKCTLFFDTVRTGFPTAQIDVVHNLRVPADSEQQLKVEQRCTDIGASYTEVIAETHRDFIKTQVYGQDGPLIIIDPDTLWWDDCEDFDFPTVLAGRLIPTIYNEFSRCLSYQRFHTSFLWIRSCRELREALAIAYPPAQDEGGEYCPCDPFTPSVKFVRGLPMFWDTASNLYNMIGGTAFTPDELDRYTHVNSASAYDLVLSRVSDKEAFKKQHELALTNPTALKGFWKAEDAYYEKMAEKLKVMMEKLGVEG